MTGDLYNSNLFANLMMLIRQILFNLAIAAITEAISMRISGEQVSSYARSKVLETGQLL